MIVWGRIVWWNVFAFNLALPGFIYGFCSALDTLQRVKLTNVSGYLYNDENKTSGTLTFEANQPCSGYVRVSFYGKDGGFLLSKQYDVSLSGSGTASGGRAFGSMA